MQHDGVGKYQTKLQSVAYSPQLANVESYWFIKFQKENSFTSLNDSNLQKFQATGTLGSPRLTNASARIIRIMTERHETRWSKKLFTYADLSSCSKI